ncbi:MAG: MBL fold metallo-hydrolase [Oscillibacter sp.]
MTTLHTLASGSSGNALVISHNGKHLLLDAGISCRRITVGLQALDLTPADLSGILITHTHSDHICGLQTLVKRCAAPIYASERTVRELQLRLPGIADRLQAVSGAFTVDGCAVEAFATSHDAPGSCGYRVEDVGVLTDSGYVPEAAGEILAGVSLLVLEANHDVETLESGAYPYFLKKRILGDQGHLSNETAGQFAAAMARQGTEEIVLAHLSRENNSPQMAYNAVAACLRDCDVRLTVAPRDSVSPCYGMKEERICKR